MIGDIRDYERMEEVIREYGVNSIYHAAAYKHVPMMEHNVIEAVTNNVIGLDNMVNAAYRNGVSSFVMISSDKAVNPTNIMGLTKRVTELIVSSMPSCDGEVATRFVSVRFGNVLGSNGSVVPIFKAADCQRRAGNGYAPGHAPLFHDHPGGRTIGAAGFRHGQRIRNFRAGHGRARADSGTGDAI